ncbi:MAG: glycerol-3-phosphate 1-O-acyltransferase PlsY [Gemmatimonadota bacterium]
MIARILLAVVASYLLGAIPTSLWVVRAVKGIDLRSVGSGNLGATNLYRLLGFKYAIPVGIFDSLKGAIPVAFFGPWAGLGVVGSLLLGVVAVIGHAFSVFAGFKGGKGVATGSGIVLGLAPWAFLVTLAVWAITVKLSGYVSLGSILAAAALPSAVWILHPDRHDIVWWLAALSATIIWLHRANIRRLINGTENRFGNRDEAQHHG